MKEKEQTNNILLWLVAIGFFMEILDATIVNTALPSMARDLKVSPLSMQSIVIVYALTLAVFIPASGWLSDRFGTRKVFFSAILIFTIASFLCAISPTLETLILSRILQGAGGSMLLPVGRLAILRAFPGDKYLPALTFVAMPALIAPLIGPSLGGWIVQTLTWHYIFLINIPIGIVGCIATYKAMPKDDCVEPRKFDFLGFFLITSFMVSITCAFEGLSELNLSRAIVLLLFIFGILSLVAYVFRSLKVPNPLLSLELFNNRNFSIGILGNMFARIGSSCMPFLLPMFLQLCLGFSPLEAALTMLPMAIAAIIAKRFVSRVVLFMGYRSFLIFNTTMVGLSITSFASMSSTENPTLRLLQFFIFGTFSSLQFTAMNTLTMKDLDRRLSSHGNTMFSMVQMLSMSFSVAAAGSLLATFMNNFDKLKAFHLTFFCMGVLTCASAWIFAQLKKNTFLPIKPVDPIVVNEQD
jgi:EmrB/QacA subfamily drug resistance transporter